jgi:hypothetical protein
MGSRKRRLMAGLLFTTLSTSSLILVSATPAFAACTSDGSFVHTANSGVKHGWERFFCQPANDYLYNAFTNHGHGTKSVNLAHSDGSHIHCVSVVSGSNNAFCSDHVNNKNHYSFHDVASTSTCYDRFNDGHGFDCHIMEAIP